MLFWITLDLIIIVVVFIVSISRDKYRFILNILYGMLMILAMFRKDIATDYTSYERLFYSVSVDSLSVYPEYTFILISDFFRNLGFKHQIIFVIYSFIAMLYFYKAIKFWSDNNKYVMCLALGFFSVSFINGYWESMNTIRQTTGCMLLLYAGRYIYEKRVMQYFMYAVVATSLHYSLVVSFFVYNLPTRIKNKNILYIMLLGSVLVSNIGLESIVYSVLEYFGRGISYIDMIPNKGTGLGFIFQFMMAILSISFIDKNNPKHLMCNTFYIYGVCIVFALMNTSTISRLGQFLYTFWFISLPYGILNISKGRIKYLTAVVFLIINFLAHIYMLNNEQTSIIRMMNSDLSSGNIEYNMNFDLF